MRLIGFLLILAGLALAVGYPLYQSDFTGDEFYRERIYDRKIAGNTNSWYPVTVELKESQNPIRIRLEGRRAANDRYIGTNYPVTLELTGPEGTVLSAGLDMNLASDPDRPNPGEQRLYINAPDFDVFASGPHTLKVTPQLDSDVSVLFMDVVFLENVERPENTFLRHGLVMAGVGAAMWFIGSRRRKGKKDKNRKNRQPKRSRWGRQ